MAQAQLQLGKAGLTDNFLKTLETYFLKHKDVKISVLKSSSRDEIKEVAQKITTHLGENYTARVVGFKIALKKWRKKKV